MFYQISSTIYEENHLLPLIDSNIASRVTEKGPTFVLIMAFVPKGLPSRL